MCRYIFRLQEVRGGDFESKTEISLSCQQIAGKKLYTVFIYGIYVLSGYILYIYTQGLSLFCPDL